MLTEFGYLLIVGNLPLASERFNWLYFHIWEKKNYTEVHWFYLRDPYFLLLYRYIPF